jgi:small subunit ribosomal protein S21
MVLLPYLQGGNMAEVRIENRDDFEKGLRGFRMQCKREGIVKRFRERQYYTKPSQKRRIKKKQSS